MMTFPQNPETKTIILVVEENRQRLKRLKKHGKLTKEQIQEQILDCLGLFTHNENALCWYQQALIENSLDRVNWDEILDKVNSI